MLCTIKENYKSYFNIFLVEKKFTNFADILRNNTVFPQEVTHLKISAAGKVHVLTISRKFHHFTNKSIFMQKYHVSKNISYEKSSHFDS